MSFFMARTRSIGSTATIKQVTLGRIVVANADNEIQHLASTPFNGQDFVMRTHEVQLWFALWFWLHGFERSATDPSIYEGQWP